MFARLYLDTGRADRAEDLLQETYLRAFRAVRWLDDPAGFRPWLLAIAHNALIDDARQAARLKRTPPSSEARLALLPSPELTPDKSAELTELRERVLGVLRSLPAEYQMPLTLRDIAGADYDSIGEQLGLTNRAIALICRGNRVGRVRGTSRPSPLSVACF